MGQQQLLLLVLGVVIVGLAVVVGINAFSENQRQSNADAMVTDALRIASDIQAQALKPEQFGGAGGWENASDGSDGISWDDLGYSADGDDYENANGVYQIGADVCQNADAGTADYEVWGTNDNTGNDVCVGLSGTSSDDIATDISYGS